MLDLMGTSLVSRFILGLGLGLVAGTASGVLVSHLQTDLRLAPGFLWYDSWVGAVLGLVAGWCYALQTVLKKLFRDLFKFFSAKAPWFEDARAPQWLSGVRQLFSAVSGRSDGLLKWFLGKWVLSRLTGLTPFRNAVERAEKTWKKPDPPTPQDLSFEALLVLLRPLDIAFAVAYGLLFLLALLGWSLPVLFRMLP